MPAHPGLRVFSQKETHKGKKKKEKKGGGRGISFLVCEGCGMRGFGDWRIGALPQVFQRGTREKGSVTLPT